MVHMIVNHHHRVLIETERTFCHLMPAEILFVLVQFRLRNHLAAVFTDRHVPIRVTFTEIFLIFVVVVVSVMLFRIFAENELFQKIRLYHMISNLYFKYN